MRCMLVAIAILASAVPASASYCVTTTSDPEVDTYDAAPVGPRFYFDFDPCNMECLWSMWLYEESNGIPGLQRNDSWRDDTCEGQIRHDTIIY